MPASTQARQEFIDRQDRERQKALAKYGETATRPDGNPTLDVLDYCINELVGLPRYADMVEARTLRVFACSPWLDTLGVVFDAGAIRDDLTHLANTLGPRLIDLRNALLAHGCALGAPESR